jgi:hypothetical protein
MKNKLLILVIGLALTTQMVMAQAPSYVPTDGLVGYWPFNGNANDESGNANNGVVNGATLTTDRFGNTNKSFSFNGTSDFINLGNIFNNLQTFSFTCWFLRSDDSINGEYYEIFSKQFCFSFSLHNTTNKFHVNFGNGQVYNIIPFESISDITNLNWHNVTITRSLPSGEIKLYYDGQLENSGIITTSGINTYDLQIGSKYIVPGVDNPWFKGLIDDIGIWNRALTQDEIANLYYAENTCQSLVINTGVLSFNPPTYSNTVTIYPNPANDQITIDCGNLANVSGWTIKIVNTLGQEVFSGAMNTQQYLVPLNSWSGQGIYFVKIYDGSNNLMNTKKIILQ